MTRVDDAGVVGCASAKRTLVELAREMFRPTPLPVRDGRSRVGSAKSSPSAQYRTDDIGPGSDAQCPYLARLTARPLRLNNER
jgi:hypothetical protein